MFENDLPRSCGAHMTNLLAAWHDSGEELCSNSGIENQQPIITVANALEALS